MLVKMEKKGKTKAGITCLEEAQAFVEDTGTMLHQAEIYRVQGELWLRLKRQPSDLAKAQEEAEACFGQALQVSQQQQAKPMELRAAMSLSRLWHQQGKTAQARQLLAETYEWFSEGFATRDLQAAKALLNEFR